MVSGNATALRGATSDIDATIAPFEGAVDDAISAIATYNSAPSDLAGSDIADVATPFQSTVDRVRRMAAIPAAFAAMVEAVDGDPMLLGVLDQLLYDAWVDNPDFTSEDAILADITGTPAELAATFRDVLAATSELEPGEIEDLIDTWQAELGSSHLAIGEHYNGVLITPENRAQVIFEFILMNESWDDALSQETVDQLLEATARLSLVAHDEAFTVAMFEDLGPEATAQLPQAVANVAWSETYTSGGDPPFDARDNVDIISVALGTASGGLDQQFWDSVFEAAVYEDTVENPNLGWWGDDKVDVINDSFPMLFAAGTFVAPVAQQAGQLGLDILNGQYEDGKLLHVRRGPGSPFYGDFDQMATPWEERATVLVDAAARTPEAANALLLDERNARVITDNEFGRDEGEAGGEHTPRWGVISDSVSNLIEAGTVEYIHEDGDAARQATANIINFAVDSNPGSSHEALSMTYATIAAEFLPEFAMGDAGNVDAFVGSDGNLYLGALQATRFTALGMHSEEGVVLLAGVHQAHAFDIALSGIETEMNGTDTTWEEQLGRMDAIMLDAFVGEGIHVAAAEQAAAEAYNARLATGQTLLYRAAGLAPHTKLLFVTTPVADWVRTEFLEQDTGQVAAALSDGNDYDFQSHDFERDVVASAHLVAAIRAEAAGLLDIDGGALSASRQAQVDLLDAADQVVDSAVMDSLRDAAAGRPFEVEGLDPQDLIVLRAEMNGMEDAPFHYDAIQAATARGAAETRILEALHETED